jgi:hypothetical protein
MTEKQVVRAALDRIRNACETDSVLFTFNDLNVMRRWGVISGKSCRELFDRGMARLDELMPR